MTRQIRNKQENQVINYSLLNKTYQASPLRKGFFISSVISVFCLSMSATFSTGALCSSFSLAPGAGHFEVMQRHPGCGLPQKVMRVLFLGNKIGKGSGNNRNNPLPISYLESSGVLVSGWSPVETLENSKKFKFFDWLLCFSA